MADNPVIDLLRKRRATRAIKKDPLPGEVVEELIEAARLAPSCYNNQPWHYIFCESEEGLKKGREALTGGNREWATTAPLLIAAWAREEDDCQPPDGRSYHQLAVGMSIMNLMLAATHLGLVARPMAGYKPDVIRGNFDLDDEAEVLVMIAVGYPGDDESHVPDSYKGIGDKPRTRKEPEEIVNRV